MSHALSDLVLDAELAALRDRYGDFPYVTHRIEMQRDSLKEYRAHLKRRRGEILLVLARPSGEVLMHTKHFYPQDVYRLPTGGIDWNEPVVEAWHRELWEETQLKCTSERLLGVIGYEFVCREKDDADNVPFVTFVFQQSDVTGVPIPEDESEQISDFRWMPLAGLKDAAANLSGLDRIGPDKGDWGRFRAVAHHFVHDALG